MKNILLAVTAFLSANAAIAQTNFCTQHSSKSSYLNAISAVAIAMNYTYEELCSLSTLSDIQIEQTVLLNQENEYENHSWITLHYETYSCQYFVRDQDQFISRKNCYNTG